MPIAVAGLKLSHVAVHAAPPPRRRAAATSGIGLGNSLLFTLLERLVLGPLPQNASLVLHPVAFAAWIGFFVTAINLLPVGQLDGGHVLYALAGHRQEGISRAVVLAAGAARVSLVGLVSLGRDAAAAGPAPPAGARGGLAARDAGDGCWALIAAVLLVLTLAPAPFTM